MLDKELANPMNRTVSRDSWSLMWRTIVYESRGANGHAGEELRWDGHAFWA